MSDDLPSVYRQLVTDDDNRTHDVGAFGVLWIMIAVLGTIPFLIWLTFSGRDPQPLGVAVGAVCGGYATALAAFGAYRKMSRPEAPREDRNA